MGTLGDSRDGLENAYRDLLGLSPPLRVTVGAAVFAAGGLLTLLLWERGVHWGMSLSMIAVGGVSAVSGLVDIRRWWRRERQIALVIEREAELVAGMTEAKKRGESPIRWLTAQGIVDAEIRGYLLKRLASSGGA